mgnify:CR=1 FL=1
MNKFGQIKSKLLVKLTESYSNQNKNEMKDILKLIKENKKFKEMYLFYEEIENKYIEDRETAKLYVEGVETMMTHPSLGIDKTDLSVFCETLNEKLGDVKIENNELYECLDVISQKNTLSNIEEKVVAKKKLVEHLTKKKETKVKEDTKVITNESLLHTILASNFNVLYSNMLNEEQQKELKNILDMSYSDVLEKTSELREGVLNQVNSLLTESTDSEIKSKLENVKKEIIEMLPSKYNYYRLTELKNGLN